MNLTKIITLAGLLLLANSGLAQEHNHDEEHLFAQVDSIHHPKHDNSLPMSHAFSRNLPMNRNGSGVSWLPDATPMHGYMLHSAKWIYMLHGNIFLRYNNQDVGSKGTRGSDKFDAPNWFMGMGQAQVGSRGLFRFSGMISLDPLTVGGEGYPLLLQSGETWEGEPLVDRQHPHDLFSELSVGYTHMLSEDVDAFTYLGYPGEPAFGPVDFMHRASSLYNPDAPLGHHWQDATHITFGVGTLGFRYRNMKVEGSLFTGREPDEDRYGFDRPRFDSWSTRLSYNPSPAWALQVSKAWVKDVHQFGPREDVNKTTASAIHSLYFGATTSLNSAIVWGYNNAQDHHAQHSVLLESALRMNTTTIYGKYEWVEKSTENLLLDEDEYGHGTVFPVNAVSLGVQENLTKSLNINAALGVQGSLYVISNQLETIYGKNPMALEFYLQIYPGLMSSGARQ